MFFEVRKNSNQYFCELGYICKPKTKCLYLFGLISNPRICCYVKVRKKTDYLGIKYFSHRIVTFTKLCSVFVVAVCKMFL